MTQKPKKSGSGTTTDNRPTRGSDREPDGRLKKAIDRPIDQPEQAREEAPIGWYFGPDGQLISRGPGEGGGLPAGPSEIVAGDQIDEAGNARIVDEAATGSVPASLGGGPEGGAAGNLDEPDGRAQGGSSPGGVPRTILPGAQPDGGGAGTDRTVLGPPAAGGDGSRTQPAGGAGRPDTGDGTAIDDAGTIPRQPAAGAGGDGSTGTVEPPPPATQPGGGETPSTGGTDGTGTNAGGGTSTGPIEPPTTGTQPGGSGVGGDGGTKETPSTGGTGGTDSTGGGGGQTGTVTPPPISGGGGTGTGGGDTGTGPTEPPTIGTQPGDGGDGTTTPPSTGGGTGETPSTGGGGETDTGGTPQPPLIAEPGAGGVEEDVVLSASGQLTASGSGGTTWSVVGNSAGPYGGFTLGPDGSWSYVLDNETAQGLKAGETVQEIFTVRVTDASGASDLQTVTVTVAGTNDMPVISGAETGVVQEDEALSTSGTLVSTDPDIGDTASWSVVGGNEGSYGSFTLNPDGTWSYILDNDKAQGLKAGETADEIFTIRVTDSTGASDTQTITVGVSGTNDVPVISGTETGLVQEDEALTASGTLTVSDADIGDTATWSVVGNSAGHYGSLTLGDDGTWSYTLDNDAAQGLKAGDTAQEIFTVKVTDSAGAEVTETVTVIVTGTNDVPVISGSSTGSVDEDGTLTAGGSLDLSDADIGDTATWSVVGPSAGDYGSLILGDDGAWSYTLDNDAAQGLKAGETAQEIFTVQVTDSAGASSTQTVTVTVTGTNDVPVISGTETGAVAEDGTLTASGALDVSDADIGDTASWSVVGPSAGDYGSFVLGNDGNWSYTLDNDAAQGLKAGETVQEIFTVKVTDASGASDTQTVTVTVTGTNDMPVISGIETGLVQEDETLTAAGQLTALDPDIGDTATWSVVGDAGGLYGALTLNPDGSWSYALDNDAAEGLKAGQTAEETFVVRVTDAEGASADQAITVTVSGTNDVPVISGAGTGAVKEDEALTASGSLASTDADIGDTATWSVVGSSAGQYGNFAVGDDGVWSYTLDDDAAQGLKAGDTVQEIFTVRVTDSAGAEATQTVIVTVTGTNDTPVISGTETGAVQEDETLTASGTLTSADADIGDTATWSVVGSSNGGYGSLTLGEDGQWSYALNSDAAQGLKAGETVHEIFTVKVTDASGASDTQTVTVTVTGTNDTPVISGTETGSVQEDEALTASGSLTVSDPDIGDTIGWSMIGPSAGNYGSLVLGDDGHWSYTLDNNVAQGLKAGETAQEIFTVKVTDASGASDVQTVTVTVTGTNDAPAISGTATGIVQEDEIPTVSGTLTSSDADIGDTAAWSVIGANAGQYGSLALGEDGAWTYTLDNNAAQGLKAGDSVQEIFTVKVIDAAGAEATQTITVTVHGTNDAPLISGSATGTVDEDGLQTASGVLTSTDADIGDTATWSVVGQETGAHGSLTIGGDGRWSYALDNDTAQGLKAGETAQEIFTVKVTDAAGAEVTQTITVTVTGTNDAPVISGAATGSVDEDGTLAAGGKLDVSDADIGDTATWSVVGDGSGAYGGLTLNQDGSWSYTLDNDKAQSLKAGDTTQEIFTVKVTDSAGAEVTQTITVTVTGTNDVPVISGATAGSVDEDGTLTAGGRLDVSDADIGDTATWSVAGDGSGAYGGLALNQDGSWSYALDNDAAQGLKAGETAEDSFTVRVTDASGAVVNQVVTVTITGTNDTPVISGTATGTLQEDQTLTAGGKLDVSDADIGDTAAWSVVGSGEGTYGDLVLGDDGSWSYTLDNDAAQGLKAGDTAQEIFTVKVTDAAGAEVTQTITVTVSGTNDAPVISGTAAGTVQEDEIPTVSGALTGTDVDIGDTATWSVVGSGDGQYGNLSLNQDGTWSYALDNDAAQGLKAGDTAQEIFTVKVTDAAGAEATQTITVTVTGTNDAPVISGTATGSVDEDGMLTAGGRLDVSDADIGDTATWSVIGNAAGFYGGITLNQDGTWSYALDNDAAQGLKAGDTAQEIFTVKVTDSAGAEVMQTITVTVTGTNDTPAISGAQTGEVQEDAALTASGALTAVDPDIGDTATWSVVGSDDGHYGALTLDSDGAWSYALNNDVAQSLKAGETAQEIFTVKVTDAAGASDIQTVTIIVTGTNDAPVISGVATGSVAEDGALTAGGSLDVFDADSGDTASWSIVGGDAGSYGSLTIDENGRWSYALDNGKAQGLKAGETVEETFTVRVTDASGASAEQTITVTVSGTNDVPVIAGTSTGQVQEDVTLAASGTLTAADADIGDTASWSVDGSATSDHGVFAIDPDSGQWTFTLDNDTAQGLKAGETIRETFTVRVTDSAGASETHLVSVEITGTNDGPQVGQALNNMGSMKEDTSITFSAEDLLRGAQVTDIDQDNLTITTVGLNGSSAPGTLVDNGNGTWTFTPNHNVSNDNVDIVFQVSDGHTSVSAQASVAIQPVADPADVSITSSAIQEVIKTGDADDLGRIVAPQLTTKQLAEFTLEFTVVGNSVPESTTGAGPVIVNIGSPPSDKNTLTLWDPANMKVGMSKPGGGDINIATGVDLTDGQSHRVTVTYDGKTNTLKVYDNGDLALTTSLPKPLPSTLYMAVAEKANTPPTTSNPAGSGYRANEHFEGTIFNVAMANKAETAQQVHDAPLAEQMKDNLLIDLRAQNDKIVDTTGRNSIKTGGAIDTDSLKVDTDLGSAPVGSVVHLDIDTKLQDPNDHLSSLVVSGFVAGTVVSDGVHSVTVTGPTQKIDITNWSHDNLTADLPDGARTSMDLKVTATTTTPPYETGEVDGGGDPILATNSATSDEHHTLLVEGAGAPPPLPPEDVATAMVPDEGQPGTDDTVVPGSDVADTGGGTSEETPASGQQETKPGSPAEGGDTTTSAPDTDTVAGPDGSKITDQTGSGSGETGTIVVPGTEPPVSTDGGASDETSTGTNEAPPIGTQPDSGGTTIDSSTGGGSESNSGQTIPDTLPPLSTDGGDTLGGGTTGAGEPPTGGTEPDGGVSTGSAGGDAGSGSETVPGTEPPLSAGGGDTVEEPPAGATEPPAAGEQSGGDTTVTSPAGDGTDSGQPVPDTSPPLSAGGESTTGETSTGATEPPISGGQPDGADTAAGPSTGADAGGDGGTTSSPDGGAGETGTITVPETEPPILAGGDHTGETSVGAQPDGGDPGSGITVPGDGSDMTPVIHEPVDANGQISFVSVNDWYNPSWGGGYNATFQLTLTDDMLKGGSLEGWSLQIGINNPNATVSTGWLDGFNGTVSFDPATGVFTNAGQDYQPELHAGDVIQFSIQVQNTGFSRDDFSFSFQDLDPMSEGTADSGSVDFTPTEQGVDSWSSAGDAEQAASTLAAASGTHEAIASVTDSQGAGQDAPAAASADQGGGDQVPHDQPLPSAASAYLDFVQSQADDQASALQPADHQPSITDEYLQMAGNIEQAGQEPPPPDHLFADAQVEHGSGPGADASDAQHDVHHDDAAAAAAPDLSPLEEDQNHHNH